MDWSKRERQPHRAHSEICDELGMVIDYKETATLTTPLNTNVSRILARVDRFKGERRDKPNVYKVGVRERFGEGAYATYYLFDSSLSEAKRFAEAMVKAQVRES